MQLALNVQTHVVLLWEEWWDIELWSEKLKIQGLCTERGRIIEWQSEKEMLREAWVCEETGLVYEGFDSGRRRAAWSQMLYFSSHWPLRAHLSVSLTHTLSHLHACYHIVCFEKRLKEAKTDSIKHEHIQYTVSIQYGCSDATCCHPTHKWGLGREPGEGGWLGQRLKLAKLWLHRLHFPGALVDSCPRSPPALQTSPSSL